MYQAKSIPKTMLIGTPQRPTSIGITTMLPSLLPPLQTSLNSSLSPCFGVRAIRPPSSVTYNPRSRLEQTSLMFLDSTNQMGIPARTYSWKIILHFGTELSLQDISREPEASLKPGNVSRESNLLLNEGILTPRS